MYVVGSAMRSKERRSVNTSQVEVTQRYLRDRKKKLTTREIHDCEPYYVFLPQARSDPSRCPAITSKSAELGSSSLITSGSPSARPISSVSSTALS